MFLAIGMALLSLLTTASWLSSPPLEVCMAILRKITNVLRYGRWIDSQHRQWGIYIDRHHPHIVRWICRACGVRKG